MTCFMFSPSICSQRRPRPQHSPWRVPLLEIHKQQTQANARSTGDGRGLVAFPQSMSEIKFRHDMAIRLGLGVMW